GVGRVCRRRPTGYVSSACTAPSGRGGHDRTMPVRAARCRGCGPGPPARPAATWAAAASAPRATREIPMRYRPLPAVPVLASVLLAAALSLATAPVDARAVSCRLSLSVGGWSLSYTTGAGTGHVRGNTGRSMAGRIGARGGGLTVGKPEIRDGRGEFSAVRDVREVLGTYAAAEAHAGA